MSDLHLIIPVCYNIDKYHIYSKALNEGIVLGIIIMMLVLVFIEICNNITEMYEFKEEEEQEEKSDDDKKED
jgi:hypothetical protein